MQEHRISALAVPTTEARFRRIMADCAGQFEAALKLFLGSDDPEGPHRARVSLRRMATATIAFSPILRRKRAERLRRRIKRLFRALGQVRDSDVFMLARMDAPGQEKRLKENRRLRDRIRKRLARDRVRAFARDLADIAVADAPIYRRSAAALAIRNQPISDLAAVVLDKAWKQCLDYGAAFASIPNDRRHDFRKDLKSLRYLDEFLAGSLAQPVQPGFRRTLEDLQDALGTLNDYAVACAIDGPTAPALPPDAVRTAEDRAERIWANLAASGPPWLDGRAG